MSGLVTPFIRTPSPEQDWAPLVKLKGEGKCEPLSIAKYVKKEEIKDENGVKRTKEETSTKREVTVLGPKKEGSVEKPKKSGAIPVDNVERGEWRMVGREHKGTGVPTETVSGNQKDHQNEPPNENHTYNIPMDVGAAAHWVNWSFDAGRQFQAQKVHGDMRNQQRIMNPVHTGMSIRGVYGGGNAYNVGMGMDCNRQQLERAQPLRMNPPGLVPMGGSGGLGGKTGEIRMVSSSDLWKGKPMSGLNTRGGKDSSGYMIGKGRQGCGKSVGPSRSLGAQSNASSKGSSRNNVTTIKNSPNQRSVVGGAVSAHREDKRERLDHVKVLLDFPDNTVPSPNVLVSDSGAKQETRKNAWALWEVLDAELDEGPKNPEYGFNEEVAKMAKMGKGFLRMARMGGNFSDGKVVQIWTRQVEQTGKCEREGFEPKAYSKAVNRYHERRMCRVLQ